jgi:pentatricopeptide repeat protein
MTKYCIMTHCSCFLSDFTLSSTLKSCRLYLGKMIHSYAIKQSLDKKPYVATALLDMYARGGDVEAARFLFDEMPDKPIVSATAMITCYAKQGDLVQARHLFDETSERDSICWNAMMDGYTQYGRPNDAVILFREMLKSDARPNEVTILSVLSAIAQLGCVTSGKWVHSFINNKHNRIVLNAKVGNTLIDMYYKCGSLEDACLVFDEIKKKDIVVWNSMIAGYAMHGQSQKALKLFDMLRARGLWPTDITFIGVLNACSHAGLVEQGRRFFLLMEREYKMEPKIEHYGCMVDLLGRAGLIEEAYDLIKRMKGVEPDAVMWGSLLSSCRLHNNMVLGEKIANHVVSQGIANSGTYVLLSNIYAAVGNWEKVAWVRQLMKESGVQKEPGCSAIELNNKVYEFVVGDRSHPKSKKIYAKLDELSALIKAHGYVPNTDLVLQDLEEAEKKKALAVHSERIAVAFGLISTEPGTEIKIVKNLRVCADCHDAFKLIAKVTDRRIVVRDRNRFHHFSNGSCSCGDYW